MATPRCEWQDCLVTAAYEVNAQWTVVDFVAYYACLDHVEDMLEWLDHRRIDGNYPADVWTTQFDLEQEVKP